MFFSAGTTADLATNPTLFCLVGKYWFAGFEFHCLWSINTLNTTSKEQINSLEQMNVRTFTYLLHEMDCCKC